MIFAHVLQNENKMDVRLVIRINVSPLAEMHQSEDTTPLILVKVIMSAERKGLILFDLRLK